MYQGLEKFRNFYFLGAKKKLHCVLVILVKFGNIYANFWMSSKYLLIWIYDLDLV
jgi:hypothetical protein